MNERISNPLAFPRPKRDLENAHAQFRRRSCGSQRTGRTFGTRPANDNGTKLPVAPDAIRGRGGITRRPALLTFTRSNCGFP